MLKKFREVFYRYSTRMLKRLNEAVLSAYASPDPRVRRWAQPVLFHLRRAYYLAHSGTRFNVYRLKGIAVDSHLPLRVIYFENGQGLNYLENILFEEGPTQREKLGRLRSWQVAGAAQSMAAEADLVVVERNHLLRWTPPGGEWVTGPTWVRMVRQIDPQQTWEEVKASFRRQKENMNRIRRAGYTYEISQSDEDFDYFYDCMHAPTVQERHEGYGIVDARRSLYSQFKQGHIMFIRAADGERVAGALNVIRGEVYFGVANGFLADRPGLLESGVLSALYVFAMQWSLENGYRRCDICEVRPFSNDGLYRHKERWGFEPVAEILNTREWLIWAPNGGRVAHDWLERHPFVTAFARWKGAHLESVYNRA